VVASQPRRRLQQTRRILSVRLHVTVCSCLKALWLLRSEHAKPSHLSLCLWS